VVARRDTVDGHLTAEGRLAEVGLHEGPDHPVQRWSLRRPQVPQYAVSRLRHGLVVAADVEGLVHRALVRRVAVGHAVGEVLRYSLGTRMRASVERFMMSLRLGGPLRWAGWSSAWLVGTDRAWAEAVSVRYPAHRSCRGSRSRRPCGPDAA
jgi:hypothetical protein